MLDDLFMYFMEQNLDFFWDDCCNLLNIFNDHENHQHLQFVMTMRNTFDDYANQPNVSYQKVARFFQVIFETINFH